MNIDEMLRNSDYEKYTSKLRDAGISTVDDLNQLRKANELDGILKAIEPNDELRLNLDGYLKIKSVPPKKIIKTFVLGCLFMGFFGLILLLIVLYITVL